MDVCLADGSEDGVEHNHDFDKEIATERQKAKDAKRKYEREQLVEAREVWEGLRWLIFGNR
jgi:hypothetical protein